MGSYFYATVLDVLRVWIGSSESGDLKPMTEDQIRIWQEMEDRHEQERQSILREIFETSHTT